MGMVLFTSLYSVADAFFVANFAGKTAFAAVTLIFPLLGMLGAVGFMLGAGGAAIVGKLLGEGRRGEANSRFSMFVHVTAASGVLLCLAGEVALRPVAVMLGAEGEMLENSLVYGRISLLSLPCFMLQFLFQAFFATAEKPRLGLAVTVAAGCANVALDALFVAFFQWGVAGAATATAISETIGGLTPIFYFARKNRSLLRLGRGSLSIRVLLQACGNGASEFLTNIAHSLLMALYTFRLLRLAGENGVAAYGALLYVGFIFIAVFLGYAIGIAPVISYNYGAGNTKELRNVFRKSVALNALAGAALALAGLAAAEPLARVFTDCDEELRQMTTRALRLYSPVFLFSGINIFGSSFFTALNNGAASAAISCLRTLVFGCGAILLLPLFLGLDGVWLAQGAAELGTLAVTAPLLAARRRDYGYG